MLVGVEERPESGRLELFWAEYLWVVTVIKALFADKEAIGKLL